MDVGRDGGVTSKKRRGGKRGYTPELLDPPLSHITVISIKAKISLDLQHVVYGLFCSSIALTHDQCWSLGLKG